MFRIGPRIDLGDEDRKQKVFGSALAILVGLGLVFLGFSTLQSQSQDLENPANVSATVVETGIEQSSSRRGGIDYQPEVLFEYSYEGENYTSTNMYPGGQKAEHYNLEENAREITQEYSQGSQITVSVPPNNPGEAFIRARETSDPLFFIAVGLLFMGVGTYKFLKRNYM